jgi:hypothetical protein
MNNRRQQGICENGQPINRAVSRKRDCIHSLPRHAGRVDPPVALF